MSTRQYIGARYVTKIYENSLDPSSAEWESGINWEPLIIVTYNNGSYMSKKFIPASVGNPADNPSYWTQTGFYNGQIAQLQQDVQDINDAIDQLTLDSKMFSSDCDVMYIGDSWGVSAHADNVDINSIMGFNNYYQSCYNGSGFVNTGVPPATDKTFEKLLTDLCSGLTSDELEAVNYLIVAGDINDTNYTSGIETNCKHFIDTAKTLLPNAKIYIFAVNYEIHGLWSRFAYIAELMKCNGYKDAVIGDLTGLWSNGNWLNSTHLTTAGYKEVSNAIICSMLGVPYGTSESVATVNYTNSTYSVNVNLQFYKRGKECYVYIPGFQIAGGVSIDASSQSTIHLTAGSSLFPFLTYCKVLNPGFFYRSGHSDRDTMIWQFMFDTNGDIDIIIPGIAGTITELIFMGGELPMLAY